ncbi:sugar-binding transcriptional regulator [Rhodobacteraceae bacterium]|jgi:deoxyribonucleoside regulator|nr:sugar-binding transcriptional regulator [Paracoccaceae bacterium]MBT6300634.1 sugar-binding transcriptional regulator [Paracoccaceae bacterium]MDA7776842.1 sugar-binding transcriptional regulator [Paracoccaceae bacterium]MDB3912116.1 sugar-binding transcriptional regulator [Paracoccaceae bacterium]HBS37359.1 LacI family transcriptional regulator [Paracoccaceae bacterium]
MTDTSSIHQTDNTIIERHNGSIDPSREMRVRAAWLYYVEGLTQQATAKLLKINRVQVTRLLAEARKRGEVDIRINASISSIIEVERAVEHAFGIAKVIIAPMASEELDPTKAIASIAGQFISNYVQSDMKIGVGWGRTLYSTLPHIRGSDLEKIRVISLLGGISQAKRFNPAEFAWQFTELFNGEGYLVPAPALVDSAETKHALLEHCGINQIFELADDLDVAFLSAGGIEGITTSYRLGHVSEAERQSLIAAGAVGDLLYNFISEDGDLVDHNVNTRVISIGIDRLKNAKDRILISGGKEKVKVLLGCLRLVKPTVFITDEITAKAILSLK